MKLKGGGGLLEGLLDEFDEDPAGERVEEESDNEYDDDEQTEISRISTFWSTPTRFCRTSRRKRAKSNSNSKGCSPPKKSRH
jgi:hypothetical protein